MKIQKRFRASCGRIMSTGICVCLCAEIMCGCTKKEQLFVMEEPSLVQEESAERNTPDASEANEPKSGEESKNDSFAEAGEAVQAAAQEIYVHICGAVQVPGVYSLPQGSRVFDVVKAAGGFTEDASPDYINQAQVVPDGCRIQIPTVMEAEVLKAQAEQSGTEFLVQAEPPDKTVGQAGAGADGKVNINTADAALLCTINGIGEGRAAAIIKYRESHGAFRSIEDIMNVDGIKQGVFEKIKEQICVK